MNQKKSKFSDIVVIGLALFAMFFGAGNLIFPPSLGRDAGAQWLIGFLSFFIADVGLALVAIIAMIKAGTASINGITGNLGKRTSVIINTLVVLCIGPFLAIPRTAATTYEMGIIPLLPQINSWLFGAIFFGLILLLSIKPSGVIDIIGKFLTPILVLCLLVLIILGILHPIGSISNVSTIDTVKEGILAGYQTMDVLASMVFILIIYHSAREKGYTDTDSTIQAVVKSSLFAAAALCIVYGGLAFLGATTSMGGYEGYNQAELVVAITETLMGQYGVVILAIIVFFACFTTAIGLVSACAAYFDELTEGKISYKTAVIAIVLFSYIISNFGITLIINLAAPVLNILYPVVLVMIFLTLFNDRISNNHIYVGAAIGAFLFCILDVIASFGISMPFLQALPLHHLQLGWVLPALIGGIIGKFVR